MLLLLCKAKDEIEKIIALKTIGNSGLPNLMPKLVEIVEEKRLRVPESIKIQAIYALRRMPYYLSKKVSDWSCFMVNLYVRIYC